MTDLQQQRLNDYLDHMIQAIEQVGEYLDDVTMAHFLSTRLLQDGVVRNLEVIGEAANQVIKKFPQFAAMQSDVPWEAVYYMRNRVIHGYASIDYELVWQVANKDLLELHAQLVRIKTAL
jgi:uncharacterized protein with HEPN domain